MYFITALVCANKMIVSKSYKNIFRKILDVNSLLNVIFVCQKKL